MISAMTGLTRYLGPLLWSTLCVGFVMGPEEDQFGTPKGSEGTRIFKGVEHPQYTGQFRISGQRATLVGSMNDASPWDHLDYAGKHLLPVQGTISIDVNELANTGRVEAEFAEGTDQFRYSLIALLPKLRSRMAALQQGCMSMGILATATPYIRKRGSTSRDGGPLRSGRMIKFFLRTMMPISW
jgi:hypothetical protein